jgi:hypothetical protein
MTILDDSLEDLERISLFFSVFHFPIFKGFEARFLLLLHWRIGASGGYCTYSKMMFRPLASSQILCF